MKKFGNKGITLVALVVTIIVLIILAGVSISLVLGQDGVVQEAKEGRDSYAEAARIENEQLANVDAFAMDIEDMVPVSETITGTITNMTDGEIEISATVNLEGNIDFTKTKYVFTTDNTPLGTNDESLYKDGTVEQSNDIVEATKAAGTYYLHVLAIGEKGSKTEIISENTATSQGKKDFDYTGSVQDITLTPGNYKLEVWGAEGGRGYDNGIQSSWLGSRGGYSYGKINLSLERNQMYVYVGGKGKEATSSNAEVPGGYNGGGKSKTDGSEGGGGGGGATDVRIGNESLFARAIVAGGGGGAHEDGGMTNAYGGGINGGCSGTYGGNEGGTQIRGGYSSQPTNGRARNIWIWRIL